MLPGTFQVPPVFDLGATFAFALTGALAGIKRGYDIVGVFFLALVSSIGGGLIRDGIFLPGTNPTPLLTDPRYIEVILTATIAGALFGRQVTRFHRLIAVIDALGLGAYAALARRRRSWPDWPSRRPSLSASSTPPAAGCCATSSRGRSRWSSSRGSSTCSRRWPAR